MRKHLFWFSVIYFVLIHAYCRSTSPPGRNQVDGLPPALSPTFWRTIACYSPKPLFVVSRQRSLASFCRSLMLRCGFLSAWHLHTWTPVWARLFLFVFVVICFSKNKTFCFHTFINQVRPMSNTFVILFLYIHICIQNKIHCFFHNSYTLGAVHEQPYGVFL